MRSTARLCIAILTLICASIASATPIDYSFQGNFTTDDELQLFWFSIEQPTDVVVRTWSYGGGSNSAGGSVAAGGFAPMLSIFTFDNFEFSDHQDLLNAPTASICGPDSSVDPVTGECADAYVSLPGLAAGTYLVALTQYDNVPNYYFFHEGFTRNGQGNFTGDMYGIPGGSFLVNGLAGPTQRTSHWAVDIDGVDAAGIPEPFAFVLCGTGLLAIGLWRPRRKN